MRCVVLGDSLVGGAAAGDGALSRALLPLLRDAGLRAEAIGVGGSTVANWMRASGLDCPGRGAVLGRWGRGSAMPPLDHEAQHRAQLAALADAGDAFIISLGTNDFNSQRPPKMWAQQAVALLDALPARAPVVWLWANDLPHQQRQREAAAALLRREADARWPGRLLLLSGQGSGCYRRGAVHPTVREHARWLERHRAVLLRHLALGRRDVLARIIEAVGMALGLAGGVL
jgi:lysophospholipase L1-like esterase